MPPSWQQCAVCAQQQHVWQQHAWHQQHAWQQYACIWQQCAWQQCARQQVGMAAAGMTAAGIAAMCMAAAATPEPTSHTHTCLPTPLPVSPHSPLPCVAHSIRACTHSHTCLHTAPCLCPSIPRHALCFTLRTHEPTSLTHTCLPTPLHTSNCEPTLNPHSPLPCVPHFNNQSLHTQPHMLKHNVIPMHVPIDTSPCPMLYAPLSLQHAPYNVMSSSYPTPGRVPAHVIAITVTLIQRLPT